MITKIFSLLLVAVTASADRKGLALKISCPKQIKGRSTGVEINNWSDGEPFRKLIEQAAGGDTK